MHITSPDLEDYVWKRLMVISVEDIEIRNIRAPVFIKTLNNTKKRV